MGEGLSVVSIIIALITPVVAFLMTAARAKTKAEGLAAEMATLAKKAETLADDVKELEKKLSRSEQDREGLHIDLDRLRAEKASKEMLDGLSTSMRELRVDIDKRFDRLEALVRGPRRDA